MLYPISVMSYNNETPAELIHFLQMNAHYYFKEDSITDREFCNVVVFVAENINVALETYKTLYTTEQRFQMEYYMRKYLLYIAKNMVDFFGMK